MGDDCPDELPGPPRRVYPGRRVGKQPKDEARSPVNANGHEQCHDNNRKWGVSIQNRGWNIAYYGYVFMGKNETTAIECLDLLRKFQRRQIDRRQFTIEKRYLRLESVVFKILSQCSAMRRGPSGHRCYTVVLGERKMRGDKRNACACPFFNKLHIECKHISACRYFVEWYVAPLLLL